MLNVKGKIKRLFSVMLAVTMITSSTPQTYNYVYAIEKQNTFDEGSYSEQEKSQQQESKGEGSSKEESEVEESKNGELPTEEFKTEESSIEESETKESKKEESSSEESEVEKSKNGELPTEESKTEESSIEESEAKESKKEESSAKESEAEKSSIDKAEIEESDTEKTEDKQTQTEDEPIIEESDQDDIITNDIDSGRILINGQYWYEEYIDSNYDFDYTKYTSNGLTINIDINWTRTPRIEETSGYIRLGLSSDEIGDFVSEEYCYFYNGCDLNCEINLDSCLDGEYWLLLYLNNECADSTVWVYKHEGKIYFKNGINTPEYTENYYKLYSDVCSLNPQEILIQYMNSSDAIFYGANEGGESYVLASSITKGITSDYDKARAIYEYIGNNYTLFNEEDVQDVMIAMFNSIGIPTIKLIKSYYKWIYFYVDGKWRLCSPYMAIMGNNVGHFDSNELFAIWDLGASGVKIYEYPSWDGKTKDTVDIAFKGNYDRIESYKVLEIVNSYRIEVGLEPLTMDENLINAAELRACETNFYYSHTRPSGTKFNTISLFAKAENIAYGQSDATEVMNSWMNSNGHKANILNENYSTIGIACFSQGNVKYWVQLFGEKLYKEASNQENETKLVEIAVLKEHIFPKFQSTDINIQVDKALNMPILLKNRGTIDKVSIPQSKYVQYQSSDTKIVSVNDNGYIIGKSEGLATIKGTIYGLSASCSVNVLLDDESGNGYYREYIVTVRDEDFNTPIGGAKVIIGDVYYETEADGTIKLISDTSEYLDVIIVKNNYITKKINLKLDSFKSNDIFLKKEINFNIQLPELNEKVKLQNSIEILGNSLKWLDIDYSLEFGPFKGNNLETTIPISIEPDVENQTVKVTFGIKQTDEDGNVNTSSYKKVKSLCDGIGSKRGSKEVQKFMEKYGYKNKAEVGVKIETQIIGYFELDNVSGKLLESGVIVAMSGAGSVTWRPAMAAGILYAKGTLELSAEGKLIMNFRDNNITFSSELDFKQALTVASGVGSSSCHLEFGAEGSLSEKIKIPFKSVDESLEISLNAKIYAELELFFLKAKKEMDLFNLQLVPWKNKNVDTINSMELADVEIDSYSVDKMDIIDRNYLVGMEVKEEKQGFYQENVYPEGTPEMCKLEDGTILAVWISDSGNKSLENRTTLVYSIKDEQGWSMPQAVCETGRGDFYPSLMSCGNRVFLVYQNIGIVLKEDFSNETMLENTDIYFTEFKNGKFEQPQLVTESNNAKLEMDADIVSDGEKVAVVWVENSDNAPFRNSGTNSIWMRELDNGQWKEKKCIVEGLSTIPCVDSALIEGDICVAYTMDIDGDLGTSDDIELFLYKNDEIKKITSDYHTDENVIFCENVLYWASDGEVMYLENTDVIKIKSTGVANAYNFKIFENGNRKIISFLCANGFSNELYVSEENNGVFMNPICLTDFGKHISDYASVYLLDGNFTTLFFIKEVLREENSIYGGTSMYMFNSLEATNLSLVDVYHDESLVQPNGNLPIELILFNGSSETVSNVYVEIKHEDTTILSKRVSCNIESGQEGEIFVEYNLDKNIKNQMLTITVTPVGFIDSDLSDNVIQDEIGLSDIAICNTDIILTNEGALLTGSICNKGYKQVTTVNFQVLESDSQGKQIYNIDCGNLAVGAEYDFAYNIESKYLEFDNENEGKYFYLKCTTDSDESLYDNNSENVVVFPARIIRR